jgi:hypothetical protein
MVSMKVSNGRFSALREIVYIDLHIIATINLNTKRI